MTIVIGGGPAGMIASYFDALNGHDVILIEKNEKLGKKLYITGKGRCNVTNNTTPSEFLNNVIRNPKFMLSSINNFSPEDLINTLENYGLPLKTERGNRVFPQSDKSSDVIKTLSNMIISVGVDVHLNEELKDVVKLGDRKFKVITSTNEYLADKVILATGGLSYPQTGSTGDGYKISKKLGHSVTKLYPSLVGINLKGNDFQSLQGLTLKNIALKCTNKGSLLYNEQGELLFTHYGVSGPLILSLSTKLVGLDLTNVRISIDLKPALDEDTLDKRILRDFSQNINKEIKNSLDALLPKSLIPLVVLRSKINENKKCNSLSIAERRNLLTTIKDFSFDVISTRGFDEAVVTAGGINVAEINPKTMESKIVKGLYFAGEIIDVDAYTGGFNLQIAFSTGYAAGNN